MNDAPSAPIDVGAVLRSKDYLRLLALSGAIGFVVALAAWCFLTVVPWIQNTVFLEIPAALGFYQAPFWWPLPVLAIAGVITSVVIVKMHGEVGARQRKVSAAAVSPNRGPSRGSWWRVLPPSAWGWFWVPHHR